MHRRDLLKWSVTMGGVMGLGKPSVMSAAQPTARVVVVKAEDRAEGIRRALALWGGVEVGGKHVVVKPNFNSADAFPGSTHPDTLEKLVDWLGSGGAARVTVADRSGMGDTKAVMQDKGIFTQARKLGYSTQALDELPARDWIAHPLPGGHWRRGVLFPRLLEEADAIVSTCCLKTHRFGGRFTLSLKNSVGAVAKHGPDGYNYMSELHAGPGQRKMIAEINQLYRPAVVLLDGIEAFVSGGPESGVKVAPGVIIVGADRVAVDAVGVAVLRLHGVTGEVAQGPVFGQEQIARAVELGLGVSRPDAIELVTDDRAGQDYLARLRPVLVRA
jgi:uncharacterized protein (DUF362 family)